jgi:hypothetical protein
VENGDRPKKFWIYNNEIIWQKNDSANSTYLFHTECFGKCDPEHLGLGTISFHGNILRMQGSSSPKFKRLSQGTCGESIGSGGGGTQWTYYDYNNTYDMEQIGGGRVPLGDTGSPPFVVCNTTGKLAVNKNNVVFGATASTMNLDSATTTKRGNNVCDNTQTSCTSSTATDTRPELWTTGTQNVGVNAGLVDYIPKDGGPLDDATTLDSAGHGPCDPDSDGNAGTDYDGDGDQDTQWNDIAGNVVSCPTGTTALDIGAVQDDFDTGGGPDCGNSVREGSEVCDGTDLNSQTCVSQGFTTGTLACNAGCTAFDTSGCSTPTVERAIKRGVIKRGVKVR